MRSRYCEPHETAARKRRDAQRKTSSKRLYGWEWHQASREFLRDNPLCRCHECVRDGRATRANTVDHIKPHRGDLALFWDRTNWRSMSADHHSRKTAREDGGFGNPVRRHDL